MKKKNMSRLAPEKLRTKLKPESIKFLDTREIPLKTSYAAIQSRAVQALELGLSIADKGYNIYLAGEPNQGRTYMLLDFLAPKAAKTPQPPDLLYLFNFDDPDKPRLFHVPAGVGKELKHELAKIISRIRKDIPARFENEANQKKRRTIQDAYQSAKEELYSRMEAEASDHGFNLDVDDQGGMTLYPLVEGKLLSGEDFEKLPQDTKQTIKRRSDAVMTSMTGLVKEITEEEKGLQEKQEDLDKAIVAEVLNEYLSPLAAAYLKKVKYPGLEKYFAAMRDDILENVDQFTSRDGGAQAQDLLFMAGPQPGAGEEYFVRFEINLFVDNSETRGGPVVQEDHPTPYNLLGCIEREAEMGALITDFTLIKAGALHRANNGFLVLNMEDLLSNPAAWEGLLRALRAGQSRIEDPGDGGEGARTKTIEPEPVSLKLKVVLVGTDELYETLLMHEDRFPKLFKIKAHMQQAVDRNAKSVKNYCQALARIVQEADLLPFDREALAGLVDYSSRLAENQRKLTLRYPQMRDIMVEAAAMARSKGKTVVTIDDLRQAEQARSFRANLYEEEFLDEYDYELIKVSTSGQAVGRVNGLSVTWLGDYEFGLPHQIACTVGVGAGGIVDLEREAELGGPIHTKAMMILKSYLLGLFAQDKPLVMSGSLYFEQSYAGVEGDSASGAELAALLSALARVPLKLSLAFTGAVNQSGQIMAVGGVTRKVEGFFEVCRRRGLSGQQGVIIPWDNMRHLMLKEDVVLAAKAGKFAIYAVKTIEEAMELLTDTPAGKLQKNGKFTPGSLYNLVNMRLEELSEIAAARFPGLAAGWRGE